MGAHYHLWQITEKDASTIQGGNKKSTEIFNEFLKARCGLVLILNSRGETHNHFQAFLHRPPLGNCYLSGFLDFLIEIDKMPDKKFREGIIGTPAAA